MSGGNSGPVTIGEWTYASTVTAGDSIPEELAAQGQAPLVYGVLGSGAQLPLITPQVVQTKQFGNDDLDDGTPEGAQRAESYKKQQVSDGVFKQADLDRGDSTVPKQVDSKPAASTPIVPADCAGIHTGFNLSSRLTNNITLGNFIHDYPAIPTYKLSDVPAQMGLKPDEIVCNLATLCKNVWEPIKSQYPNISMTNSLRTGSNIGAGPHGTGQAMDLQFTKTAGGSISPNDYFPIAQWIRDNVAYDQLLLEYSTEHGYLVCWIHCSIYNGTGKQAAAGNRILTMMNHRVKSVGLANLAN